MAGTHVAELAKLETCDLINTYEVLLEQELIERNQVNKLLIKSNLSLIEDELEARGKIVRA